MTATFYMVGVNGDVFDFNVDETRMANAPQVFGLPAFNLGQKQMPALSAGGQRGRSKMAERAIVFPVHLLVDEPDELYALIRRLAGALDPSRGDVTLGVVYDDGSQREIVGHYTAGLNPAIKDAEATNARCDLTFRCPDPYWYATTSNQSTLTFPVAGGGGASSSSWDDAIAWDANIPWNGWTSSSGGSFVEVVVTNGGDAPAWPTWTFNGSVDGITATNLTSARSFAWIDQPFSVLGYDEQLIIETKELSRSARLETGENRYRGFSIASRDLWPLEPGENHILLEVTGADAFTSATVVWTTRSLTC